MQLYFHTTLSLDKQEAPSAVKSDGASCFSFVLEKLKLNNDAEGRQYR
jgi:hypothetical protein